jgi:small subunit ribosomal protein S35
LVPDRVSTIFFDTILNTLYFSFLEFCSKFPEKLKEIECQQKFFPLEFRYSDFIHQGTNIRDMRARQVCMGIRLDALKLDKHANLKLRQLVGDRYNKDTNVLTIISDRLIYSQDIFKF